MTSTPNSFSQVIRCLTSLFSIKILRPIGTDGVTSILYDPTIILENRNRPPLMTGLEELQELRQGNHIPSHIRQRNTFAFRGATERHEVLCSADPWYVSPGKQTTTPPTLMVCPAGSQQNSDLRRQSVYQLESSCTRSSSCECLSGTT